MQDELTERLNAHFDELKEYPERFHLHLICDGCGSEIEYRVSKDEVKDYIAHHRTRDRHTTDCDKCRVEEEAEGKGKEAKK